MTQYCYDCGNRVNTVFQNGSAAIPIIVRCQKCITQTRIKREKVIQEYFDVKARRIQFELKMAEEDRNEEAQIRLTKEYIALQKEIRDHESKKKRPDTSVTV